MEAGEVDLLLLHCAVPAALACSDMFPANAGTGASGSLFASFMRRHRSPRDVVLLGDLSERHAGAAIRYNLLAIHAEPRTPDLTTLQTGTAHASPNPFDDEAALKLSYGTDYDEDRPTKRSLGVYGFTLAQELDAHPVQFVNGLEQVLRRTSQPVARPSQQDIEPVSAGVVHHVFEFRSPRSRTAVSTVDVLANHLEALLRRELAKLAKLGFRVLINMLTRLPPIDVAHGARVASKSEL